MKSAKVWQGVQNCPICGGEHEYNMNENELTGLIFFGDYEPGEDWDSDKGSENYLLLNWLIPGTLGEHTDTYGVYRCQQKNK